jgi:hypothetical protein
MAQRPSEVAPVRTLAHHVEHRVVALSFSLSGRYLMALGDDEAHCFAVWDWGEGTVLFQGGAGNAPLVQLAPLPFGFVAVGNMEIKMWEHKAMGSQLTSDPTGCRWGAVIGSDLTPRFVKSVVTWPDPCSVVCGFVVAAGWTTGELAVFSQDDKVPGPLPRARTRPEAPRSPQVGRQCPGKTHLLVFARGP